MSPTAKQSALLEAMLRSASALEVPTHDYLGMRNMCTGMGTAVKVAEARSLITSRAGAESVGAREAVAVDARARRRAVCNSAARAEGRPR